ncbi:hypothetical protein TBLA_0C03880 [Henningerozyma blattae CBS 6284]|uniref:DFDF domain-containing protein n=1 Tax=Henningerozyma blattae (strain ATCC 34711 / CBS 6284 / DSM 70876 / NBRC 10599 / NRRL Y-10934 / UCD 77-7) TaxID=1071380 RepID=I2H1D7_HENB6|nr:hypothetical protein TBLA_0C03880 [Tetrapisispora blattae CBS 6284]CCH60189.1 hypothetical protein TBLA_0C03880 [Tetrapisispora blattae CBS 6284]
MSQYIGKTISLISTTDNRYVGLLEGIDSENSTVTLREVRCFGTEGRKNWGPEEIYPNPTIYNSVKFNGNEVKDLSILDMKIEEVQPVMPQGIWAPQVMAEQGQTLSSAASANSSQATQQPQQPQPQVPAAMAGYGVYAPSAEETASAVSETAQSSTGKSRSNESVNDTPSQGTELEDSNKENKSSFRKNYSDNRDHHGSHQNNQRYNKNNSNHNHNTHQRGVEIPTEDFDFQSNNAIFAKTGVPEQNEESSEKKIEDYKQTDATEHCEDHGSFYDKKSSFFDTISTSAEVNTNMRWQEEKTLNMDTFGQASARPRYHHRGGYRGGRGRGGRGGRGRGYNNHNNRSNNYHNNYNNNNNHSNNSNANYNNSNRRVQESNNSQFPHNSQAVQF